CHFPKSCRCRCNQTAGLVQKKRPCGRQFRKGDRKPGRGPRQVQSSSSSSSCSASQSAASNGSMSNSTSVSGCSRSSTLKPIRILGGLASRSKSAKELYPLGSPIWCHLLG